LSIGSLTNGRSVREVESDWTYVSIELEKNSFVIVEWNGEGVDSV